MFGVASRTKENLLDFFCENMNSNKLDITV